MKSVTYVGTPSLICCTAAVGARQLNGIFLENCLRFGQAST